jgi:hypothetical protein
MAPNPDDGRPRRPQMPEFPAEESSTSESRRGGFLVPLFAIVSIALILGLISVVSVGFTIVLGGIIGLIFFHYVVWGWWLSKIIIEEESTAEE